MGNEAEEMIPMKIRIWHSVLCWLGIHDWRFSAFIMKHGSRSGDRCCRCGLWHKDSVREAELVRDGEACVKALNGEQEVSDE